ncbi:hypothetical protein HRG_014533 [Hirsutella rhossiliensis]
MTDLLEGQFLQVFSVLPSELSSRLRVTATSEAAAARIGGITLHSACGLSVVHAYIEWGMSLTECFRNRPSDHDYKNRAATPVFVGRLLSSCS